MQYSRQYSTVQYGMSLNNLVPELYYECHNGVVIYLFELSVLA